MLASMLPKPAFAADNTSTFPDMPSDWSTQALQNAVNNGLLNGIDGKIAAGENLTRAQMAAIVTRAFGTNGKANISSFGDVNAGDWFYDAMASSVLMGAFQGDGVNLNPNANITRQEAFTVLARLFTLSGGDQSVLSSYTDGAQVADWAKDSMASMVAAGYVKGSDNMLNPRSSITRAEFAQVMDNLVKTYFADSRLNVNANGNAVLNKAGTLEGATISGDLIIGDGAAEGDVVLKDVTVSGRLLVRGGGTSTVTLEGNTTVGSVVVNKPTGAVRVENNTEKTVNVNAVSDNVVLTGDFNEVNANASQGTVTLTGATVATMNVAGTSAKVVVSEKSTVETMNVKGSASGAAVSVQSGTTVRTMNTAASKAVVTVNGTVNTMSVAGSDTTVKAEEGAKIEKITTSAAKTTVSGQGSVTNFEAAQGSSGADITTSGTKVVNNGTGNVTTGNDKVIASGSTGTSKSDSTGTTTPGGSTGDGDEGTPILPVSGVGVANLVDKDGAVADIATNYSVNATRTVGQDYVNVAITASNVKYHTNANSMDGYWVGFSVVAPEGAAKFKVGFADTQKDAEAALVADTTGTDLMPNIDGTATDGGEGKKGIAVYSSATADSPKTWVKLQWVNKEGANVGDATLYKMDLSNVTVAPISSPEDLKSVLIKGEKNYNISNVTLAGKVALSEAISVPSGKTLTVAKDSTLTADETNKLTVAADATVVVNGTVTGTIEGTSQTSKLVIGEGGSYNNLPVGTYIYKGKWENVEDLKLKSVETNFGEKVSAKVGEDGMSVVLSGTVPVDKLTYSGNTFTSKAITLTVNKDKGKTATVPLTYDAKTGKFSITSDTFEVDGTTYNVSVNNLSIAKTDVTPKARDNGPAAPIKNDDYNYRDAYTNAGVTFSGGINAISYTVDAAKLTGFCVSGNEDDIKALTQKIEETNYLFVGIQFDTPDNIAKDATKAMRYINGKASTEEAFDLSVDGETAYKKNPMAYIAFGSYTESKDKPTTYAPVASGANKYEVVTYWMDNGGNILAVNFSTVNRTAPTNNN